METFYNLGLYLVVIAVIKATITESMTNQTYSVEPTTTSVNTTTDNIAIQYNNITLTEIQNDKMEATTNPTDLTTNIENTTSANTSDTNHTTLGSRKTTGQPMEMPRFQYDHMIQRAKCDGHTVAPIFMNKTLVLISRIDLAWLIKCLNSVRVPKVCAPPYNRISLSFEDYTIMSIVTNIYIYIPLCLLGIIGNILSFITLSHEKQNTSITILKSLATIDSVYLLLVVLFEPFNAAYQNTEWLDKSSRDELSHKFEIAYTHAAPVINMAQMCSAWLVVLLTIDRYIAICHPFKAIIFCTRKRVRIGICIIIAFSIVYNIPLFWGISYRWIEHDCLKIWMVKTGAVRGSVGQHILYRIIYGFAGNLIFRNLLPVLLVVSLNGRLIHSLRISYQNREQLASNAETNQDHRDKNITVTLVSISFVYLICILPMLAQSILDIYFRSVLTSKHHDTLIYYTSDEGSYQIYLKFGLIVGLLVKLNSAINFLVYCLVRKGFRGRLLGLFKMVGQKEGSRHTISSRYRTSDKSKQSY